MLGMGIELGDEGNFYLYVRYEKGDIQPSRNFPRTVTMKAGWQNDTESDF